MNLNIQFWIQIWKLKKREKSKNVKTPTLSDSIFVQNILTNWLFTGQLRGYIQRRWIRSLLSMSAKENLLFRVWQCSRDGEHRKVRVTVVAATNASCEKFSVFIIKLVKIHDFLRMLNLFHVDQDNSKKIGSIGPYLKNASKH